MLFKVHKNIPYDIVVRRLEIVRLPDKQYSDMADVETQLVAKSEDSSLFFFDCGSTFLSSIFSDILMGF